MPKRLTNNEICRKPHIFLRTCHSSIHPRSNPKYIILPIRINKYNNIIYAARHKASCRRLCFRRNHLHSEQYLLQQCNKFRPRNEEVKLDVSS